MPAYRVVVNVDGVAEEGGLLLGISGGDAEVVLWLQIAAPGGQRQMTVSQRGKGFEDS